MTRSKKIIRRLASLKLAVVIMAYLCVVTAIGTIVESRYDSQAARMYVYDTFWMYLGMGALALSLLAVMIDRWPWKRRHAAFVCAHIGIIMIIVGSVFTLRWGLDGTMVIPIGQSSQYVMVPQTKLLVYASFGDQLSKMAEETVNFFERDLKKDPMEIQLDSVEFRFTDFEPYVIPQRQVLPSEDPFHGAALRFQLSNGQFQEVDWLTQRKAGTSSHHDMGPLRLRIGGERSPELKNEVVLLPKGDQGLDYLVYSKDSEKVLRRGHVNEGEDFDLGWMGLKLKVLRYHPRAQEKWDIQARKTPTPLTVSAVKMSYKGEDHWILLNDTLRVFSENTAYFISYIYERIDIGFPIQLKEFIKENYAGTNKAMAYKSLVSVPELPDQEISMNEPLKYRGLTFYQASFQEDQFGTATSSVLSVNYDPGRWIKYFGSLIMTLGIILLFYNRKKKANT